MSRPSLRVTAAAAALVACTASLLGCDSIFGLKCTTAYYPDFLAVRFVASSWPAGDWSASALPRVRRSVAATCLPSVDLLLPPSAGEPPPAPPRALLVLLLLSLPLPRPVALPDDPAVASALSGPPDFGLLPGRGFHRFLLAIFFACQSAMALNPASAPISVGVASSSRPACPAQGINRFSQELLQYCPHR